MPAAAATTLLLVPTPLEASRLDELGPLGGRGVARQLCGFGPVASAARTAGLLERLAPTRVLLVGIAGTYDEGRLPVGAAAWFEEVALEGVGAGEGARRLSPSALGLPQWPGDGASAPPVYERLALQGPLELAHAARSLLVSACSAAATEDDLAARLELHPEAAAEDMEAFGVALACRLARVPLCVVRGISNRAGDRHAARWRVPQALAAARELALEVLERAGAWDEPR